MGTFVNFSSSGSVSDLDSYLVDIGKIVTACFNWIKDEPILMLMFVAGFVGIGFYVVRKAKKTAKS